MEKDLTSKLVQKFKYKHPSSMKPFFKLFFGNELKLIGN